MALLIEAWEPDGPSGECLLCGIRSDSDTYKNNFRSWMETQKANPKCVLITKARTDNASNINTILWKRPGYHSDTTR